MTTSTVSQQIAALAREAGTAARRAGGPAGAADPGRPAARRPRRDDPGRDRGGPGRPRPDGEPAGTLRVAAFATAVRRSLLPVVRDARRRPPRRAPADPRARAGRGARAARRRRRRPGADLRLQPGAGDRSTGRCGDRRCGSTAWSLGVPAERAPGRAADALAVFDRFRDHDWIVNSRNTADEDVVRTVASLAGFRPRIAHRADSLELVQDMIVAGLGVGLLPAGQPTARGVSLRAARRPGRVLRAYAVTRRGREAWPPLALVLAAARRRAEGPVSKRSDKSLKSAPSSADIHFEECRTDAASAVGIARRNTYGGVTMPNVTAAVVRHSRSGRRRHRRSSPGRRRAHSALGQRDRARPSIARLGAPPAAGPDRNQLITVTGTGFGEDVIADVDIAGCTAPTYIVQTTTTLLVKTDDHLHRRHRPRSSRSPTRGAPRGTSRRRSVGAMVLDFIAAPTIVTMAVAVNAGHHGEQQRRRLRRRRSVTAVDHGRQRSSASQAGGTAFVNTTAYPLSADSGWRRAQDGRHACSRWRLLHRRSSAAHAADAAPVLRISSDGVSKSFLSARGWVTASAGSTASSTPASASLVQPRRPAPISGGDRDHHHRQRLHRTTTATVGGVDCPVATPSPTATVFECIPAAVTAAAAETVSSPPRDSVVSVVSVGSTRSRPVTLDQ